MSSKTNEHSLESVRAQIIDIVDQFTDVKTSDIAGESKLIQDLGLDELDILEIIMFVEEDFDIDEISDDDWDMFESPECSEKIKTIDDAARLILRLISEQRKKEAI